MNKKLNSTLLVTGVVIATLTSGIALAEEAGSPHKLTANVTLASEYIYRGIAQTRGKPALQAGADYVHSSGLYAGMWGSNISWINDASVGANASLEVDVYGGYKGSINADLGYDAGVLTYNYPGSSKPSGAAQPDTTELYAALSWKWLTVKYSSSTGSLFGWIRTADSEKTSGSSYLELNALYDMGNSWGLNVHAGHQSVNGRDSASYSDYKVGVSRDTDMGSVGLAYSTTNAKADCGASEDYCFVNTSGEKYDAGKGRLLLTLSKTF